MPNAVTLRAVEPADLPVFFEHQLDPEATQVAAFPSRERDALMAHWTKILANPECATRTILVGDQGAGNLGAWTEPNRVNAWCAAGSAENIGDRGSPALH